MARCYIGGRHGISSFSVLPPPSAALKSEIQPFSSAAFHYRLLFSTLVAAGRLLYH